MCHKKGLSSYIILRGEINDRTGYYRKLFPAHIRKALGQALFDRNKIYEIRLRVNAPLIVIYQGKEYFLTLEGALTRGRN